MAHTVERVQTARPLTTRQALIVAMLSDGMTYFAIGRHLGCSEHTVYTHVKRLASRIPGNLEPRAKLIVWWRGASLLVLTGAASCRQCGDCQGEDVAA